MREGGGGPAEREGGPRGNRENSRGAVVGEAAFSWPGFVFVLTQRLATNWWPPIPAGVAVFCLAALRRQAGF